MRSVYGIAKLAAFVLLGASLALDGALPDAVAGSLETAAIACALVAVVLCVVRGLPVIADAAAYLEPEAEPRGA